MPVCHFAAVAGWRLFAAVVVEVAAGAAPERRDVRIVDAAVTRMIGRIDEATDGLLAAARDAPRASHLQ